MSKDLHSVVLGSALAGLLLGACGGEEKPAEKPATEEAKPAEAAPTEAAKPAEATPAAAAPAEGAQTVVEGITLHACGGQNSCKGQGGCKTEKHACKGQNECKGQGGCKVDEAVAKEIATHKAGGAAPAPM